MGLILISSIGYMLIDPSIGWFDALYLTVIAVSTVGMKEGDMALSPTSRMWTIVVILAGLVTVAIVGTQLAAFVVEHQIRDILGRRQVQRRINALKNHIVVAGFGRMGALVSQELQQADREVVVVEIDPDRLAAADQAGLLTVAGDAQDETVLESAGLSRADVLVCALPSDAANLFVTLSARQDCPDLQIVARAQESTSESKLRKAGANRVVCPHVIGANRMTDVVLRPAMVDFVEMAHGGVDLEMDAVTVQAGSALCNHTLADLNLPRRVGAQVVAVRHADGTTNYRPAHDLALQAGDRLIVVGRSGVAGSIAELATEPSA